MADKVKPPKSKKKIKLLSAFAVLFGIIAGMAVLTWVIPSGEYDMMPDPKDSSKEVRKPGTYHEVKKVEEIKTEAFESEADERSEEAAPTEEEPEVEIKDRRQGLWDVLMAPIKGMVERLDVIIFILILGGFLGIVMKTGALDAGLGNLLRKMNGKEKWLIPILMTLFAIGGTTYGMQEETVAFYALIIPVMLSAGYNTMTAIMMIVLGSGVGVLASTVNPFSTGIAAKAADIPLGNILWIQGLILVAMLVAAIVFTMRYAAKVKAGGYKEDAAAKVSFKAIDAASVPENTGKRKAILAIFGLSFVLMIISLIPWGDFNVTLFSDIHAWLASLPVVGAVLGAGHNCALGEWYFNETSVLFFASAMLIAFIYRKEFKKEEVSITDTFINGAGQLLGVAVVIAVAAAVSVIMEAGGIQDTIIHWGEESLSGANSSFVGVLAYIFYLPMSFVIPSTSGLATATMPIIAPVADLVGSSRETMVVAFSNAVGLLNMIAPTVASLMAGLALSGVSYKQWLKRVAPIMGVFVVISLVAVFVMGLI